MLTVKDLYKTYTTTAVLEDVTFDATEGHIYGLIGLNGVGKSTLINILTGALSYDHGTIHYEGKTFKKDEIAIKKEIGYVPDHQEMYEFMTGREYLILVGRIYEMSEDTINAQIQKFSVFFELERSIDRRIEEYSKGMKQKLLIISAVMHEPKYLFLDEPFQALDPRAVVQFKTLLRRLQKENIVVLFSSHVLEVTENLCDKLLLMRKHKPLIQKDMKEITSVQSLETYFMGEIDETDD